MIEVLKVNKDGNKILSYTCTDGNKKLDIKKDVLVDYIAKKIVMNARVQDYKGTIIVRVRYRKNAEGSTTEKATEVKGIEKASVASGTGTGVVAGKIEVLKVNKDGNKVLSYTCTDGKKNLDMTKASLIGYIEKGVVINARVQEYKGTTIVRVRYRKNAGDATNEVNCAPVSKGVSKDSEYADGQYRKTSKKNYDVYMCIPAIGTEVTNKLELCKYTTDAKKRCVISGTVGEQSIIDINKMTKTYNFKGGEPITKESLTKKMKRGSLNWSLLETRKDAGVIWAMFVPVSKQGLTVPTSWGDVLKVNASGIEHGKGDFVVCADNNGKPNTNDRWVVNGAVFPTTYNMSAFPNFGLETNAVSIPKPSSLVGGKLVEKAEEKKAKEVRQEDVQEIIDRIDRQIKYLSRSVIVLVDIKNIGVRDKVENRMFEYAVELKSVENGKVGMQGSIKHSSDGTLTFKYEGKIDGENKSDYYSVDAGVASDITKLNSSVRDFLNKMCGDYGSNARMFTSDISRLSARKSAIAIRELIEKRTFNTETSAGNFVYIKNIKVKYPDETAFNVTLEVSDALEILPSAHVIVDAAKGKAQFKSKGVLGNPEKNVLRTVKFNQTVQVVQKI